MQLLIYLLSSFSPFTPSPIPISEPVAAIQQPKEQPKTLTLKPGMTRNEFRQVFGDPDSFNYDRTEYHYDIKPFCRLPGMTCTAYFNEKGRLTDWSGFRTGPND